MRSKHRIPVRIQIFSSAIDSWDYLEKLSQRSGLALQLSYIDYFVLGQAERRINFFTYDLMLYSNKGTHYILSKIACFLRVVKDPPKRDSGFLLSIKLIKALMFASFMCLGNFRGFFKIYW